MKEHIVLCFGVVMNGDESYLYDQVSPDLNDIKVSHLLPLHYVSVYDTIYLCKLLCKF